MLRLIISYASSTGLQRAAVFLAVPFLSKYLSLDEIGTYTLTQTTAQLVVPMMTWNATVALMREAIDHPTSAYRLLSYVLFGAFVAAALSLCLMFVAGANLNWLFLGIALGGAEAAVSASVAILQGREAAVMVLAASVVKTLGFIAIVAIILATRQTLQSFLLLQIANSTLAAAICFVAARAYRPAASKPRVDSVTPLQMVRYSAATLPHTAALWLSLSSDRILLGMMWGKASLGSYALAYTVAQAVMIVTSGVISALPPRIVRYPTVWRAPRHVTNFLALTAAATFVVILAAIAFVAFNRYVFPIIEQLPTNAGTLIALLGTGFGASIYYVLFASYMYLHRDTAALAYKAPFVGIINLFAMTGLVYFLGALGACIGLLVTYASFATAYGAVALRLEPTLRTIPRNILLIHGTLAAMAVLIGLLMQ